MYQWIKKSLSEYQPGLESLPTWQHMAAGFISGACGPLSNAPIDTIKTRQGLKKERILERILFSMLQY